MHLNITSSTDLQTDFSLYRSRQIYTRNLFDFQIFEPGYEYRSALTCNFALQNASNIFRSLTVTVPIKPILKTILQKARLGFEPFVTYPIPWGPNSGLYAVISAKVLDVRKALTYFGSKLFHWMCHFVSVVFLFCFKL